MASWMIHLRVAKLLADLWDNIDNENFYVGNIAPDSGELRKDRMSYTPQKSISHWQEPNSHSSLSDSFYDKYLINGQADKSSFYLGYYCHLLTDVLWKEKVFYPTRDKFLNSFANKTEFSWGIKKDWYQVDVIFLRSNPDFKPYVALKGIHTFTNDYLDYFSANAILLKIQETVGVYSNAKIDESYNYPYLNPAQATEFVEYSANAINELLSRKGYFTK